MHIFELDILPISRLKIESSKKFTIFLNWKIIKSPKGKVNIIKRQK
jgi:hypothetical protein